MAVNIKKLEREVKINSILLDEKLTAYLKTHKNKYVVFDSGKAFFEETFGEGVEKGVKEFGENVGFVVKKVTKSTPILSSLVKI